MGTPNEFLWSRHSSLDIILLEDIESVQLISTDERKTAEAEKMHETVPFVKKADSMGFGSLKVLAAINKPMSDREIEDHLNLIDTLSENKGSAMVNSEYRPSKDCIE